MKINTLIEAIENKSVEEFSGWLEEVENDLSNFLYRLSGSDLHDLNFDSIFFSVITNSYAYQHYEINGSPSEAFTRFIEMIAVSAERLALIGIDSMLNNFIHILPETAIKDRLNALVEFSSVESISVDYFEKLPRILELLAKAQLLDDGNNVRSSIDIFVFYLKKAKQAFEENNLPKHFLTLVTCCKQPELVAKFPMLEHPVITSVLDGEDLFLVTSMEVFRDRLEPSALVQDIFNLVNEEYLNHENIHHAAGKWWGHDINTILNHVLKRGRTDFREGYEEIGPDDKVLLYCFFNMKKHFYTSYAVFQLILPSLKVFFKNTDYAPIMIDLGCGPMTSGLALGDLINTSTGDGISFTYIGIDHAPAMLNRADKFTPSKMFNNSKFYFFESWDDVDFGVLYSTAGKSCPVFFNASYLFASDTLLSENLADFVINVAKLWENVYFIFQNPDNEIRNTKYQEFKSLVQNTVIREGVETIRYKTKSAESSERVRYEILKVSHPQ